LKYSGLFPGLFNNYRPSRSITQLGPGLGEIISRIVTSELTDEDNKVLDNFSLYRDFSGMEQFK